MLISDRQMTGHRPILLSWVGSPKLAVDESSHRFFLIVKVELLGLKERVEFLEFPPAHSCGEIEKEIHSGDER